MLIQDALSKGLRASLQSPGLMAAHKAIAARLFNQLEYPNIFLSELLQVTECCPDTEEKRQKVIVQLLVLAGLESVCSHAAEYGLDESFFER